MDLDQKKGRNKKRKEKRREKKRKKKASLARAVPLTTTPPS